MKRFQEQLEEVRSFRLAADFTKAISLLESFLACLGPLQRSEKVACLNELSQCLWEMGRLLEATENAKNALKLAKKTPEDLPGKANALNNLGAIHWQQGNLDKAEKCYRQSLVLREQIGNQEDIANSLNNLGLVYWKWGDLKRAKQCYQQSLELLEGIGNFRSWARVLNHLGIIYRLQGKLVEAEECYQQSLTLFKEIGNPQEIARCLNNIGLISWQRGELERAKEFLEKSLYLFEEIGSPQDIATPMMNLGEVYLAQGELKRAEEFLRRSLDLREAIGNLQDIAGSHYRIVRVLLLQNSLEKAAAHVNKLASLVQTEKSPIIMVQYYLANGLLKHKQHELSLALKLAEKAKIEAEEIPHFELLVDATRFLIQVLFQLYMIGEQEEYLTQGEALLRDLEQISQQEYLHGTYVESILIHGLLARAKFDLTMAMKYFQRAAQSATELGIRVVAQRAQEELEKLQKQILKLQAHQSDSSQIQEVLEYLKKVRTWTH
ncbi:MAG: tetratricopeptide repeat protein [Candidatus Hodarchaeota archaeon]